MGRPKGSGRGLVLLGVKMEPPVYQAVQAYAAEHDLTLSEAGRELLRLALTSKGILQQAHRNLRDTGYNEGLRQGLHDVHAAIQAATEGLWRR